MIISDMIGFLHFRDVSLTINLLMRVHFLLHESQVWIFVLLRQIGVFLLVFRLMRDQMVDLILSSVCVIAMDEKGVSIVV
jgi:hypothetical protein